MKKQLPEEIIFNQAYEVFAMPFVKIVTSSKELALSFKKEISVIRFNWETEP